MTKQEIKDHYTALIKWESFPIQPTGGQTCGLISRGVTLICEDVEFRLSLNKYRSQFQNKELAYTLFLLYLDEYLK